MATKKQTGPNINKPGCIYTIMCVGDSPITRRMWGYYFSVKVCHRVVKMNVTDMSEHGYYMYAVICSRKPGILVSPKEIQWYKFKWRWNSEDHRWYYGGAEKIERPQQFDGIEMGWD